MHDKRNNIQFFTNFSLNHFVFKYSECKIGFALIQKTIKNTNYENIINFRCSIKSWMRTYQIFSQHSIDILTSITVTFSIINQHYRYINLTAMLEFLYNIDVSKTNFVSKLPPPRRHNIANKSGIIDLVKQVQSKLLSLYCVSRLQFCLCIAMR